jgi:hypothetical protein
MKNISIVSIVVRVGVVIALPLIPLLPLAIFIDRRYGTLPFAIIGVFVLSACISGMIITRMIKK